MLVWYIFTILQTSVAEALKDPKLRALYDNVLIHGCRRKEKKKERKKIKFLNNPLLRRAPNVAQPSVLLSLGGPAQLWTNCNGTAGLCLRGATCSGMGCFLRTPRLPSSFELRPISLFCTTGSIA
jgi:hypothetical protein